MFRFQLQFSCLAAHLSITTTKSHFDKDGEKLPLPMTVGLTLYKPSRY